MISDRHLLRETLRVQEEMLREQRAMRRNQEGGSTGPDLSGLVLLVGILLTVVPALIALIHKYFDGRF